MLRKGGPRGNNHRYKAPQTIKKKLNRATSESELSLVFASNVDNSHVQINAENFANQLVSEVKKSLKKLFKNEDILGVREIGIELADALNSLEYCRTKVASCATRLKDVTGLSHEDIGRVIADAAGRPLPFGRSWVGRGIQCHNLLSNHPPDEYPYLHDITDTESVVICSRLPERCRDEVFRSGVIKPDHCSDPMSKEKLSLFLEKKNLKGGVPIGEVSRGVLAEAVKIVNGKSISEEREIDELKEILYDLIKMLRKVSKALKLQDGFIELKPGGSGCIKLFEKKVLSEIEAEYGGRPTFH